MNNRIVITGIGTINACGRNCNEFFMNLTTGKHAFTPYKNAKIWKGNAAGITFPLPYCGKKIQTRSSNLFASAFLEAKDKAKLKPEDLQNARFYFGTTKGGINNLTSTLEGQANSREVLLNSCERELREEFGLNERFITVSNACASGTIAVGEAYRYLKHTDNNIAVAGGADEISDFIVSGFSKLMAVDPFYAKPFDKNRKGLTPGEGAACVILEKLEPAIKRGAIPLAEITGFASSNDANHITGPSRDGAGLSLCIKKALGYAGINAEQIDFINAHGTSTVYNDAMEAKAFNTVFHSRVPVNSIKGAIGHTMGAAGAIEVVYLVKAINEKTITKCVGFEKQEPDISLNIVTQNIKTELKTCLSTSSGFGGANAALIVNRFEE